MSILNLDKIFNPQRVAVIGASDNRTSVGYTVLRNLIGSGFRGVVYPVNPRRDAVQGIEAHRDVASLPHPPDLAVICTPAHMVPRIVRECGEVGTRGIVIISAGFREIGPEGRKLEEKVLQEKAKFEGMRILGPNCLGIIVPGIHLNASFAAATPKAGHIGFISQSGALCTSVLDWAIDEGIGFSYFISVGNMIDVKMADLIDYLGSQTDTQSLILYIESVSEAREFMSAARAFSRTKPIVAYKSGRFAESAQAAASHTGAMAGVDAVYEAAFQRAGIERIFQVEDMFDCAELLARQRPPKGDRLAIITNAGGPGVMTTDALIERTGKLAELSDETIGKLNEALPAYWSHGNPVDVLGDASPERFAAALDIVLKDKGVDAVLVILTPQAMTDPTGTAQAVAQMGKRSRKPVLAAWMGGSSVSEGLQVLNRAGIPSYTTPEKAIRAFMHLVSYARNLSMLHETPRDIPMAFQLDRQRLRGVFDTILSEGNEILSENVSKTFLEAYEIPVTKPHLARTAEDAVRLAVRIGYPVVMKIHSPQITHKTDVGGVKLNLGNDEEVRKAYERMVAKAAEKRPDADILGVTVQKMVSYPSGFELIVGSKKDPVFGSVIMVGMGGTAAELFRDRALALPPLNESLARRALESLKSWPLLKGYRGRPGANIDRLIEILMRFSYLVADYPEIREIDVNPLLVTPEDVIALDARVIVDRDLAGQTLRPFAHLAIRPYPEEFVAERKLKDGTVVTLRPIKPEDEPMWHELLAGCSPESIWFRFSYLFKETTHDMAARYCFIDYDREIAIVAEAEEDGKRKLLGTGRLVADMNHETAEYAVLVVDRWQGHGLGGLLTDYCLEVAKRWGVKKVVAETFNSNARALSLFRNRGFQITEPEGEDIALVSKEVV
ncbi:MAG TPA: bifunctional acyl-CoA synthetase/GNAT family N-acetyltransferase [Planctomycetaceae bacterium]|nr:bifunctional acyl-CoA synthetase/GNAT family N-acetyltransferase [Planctomycetaceae bacterium]HIQ21029.1 bifunctional acyl-CoA synthetase/GNAT family N-acetyltransferase [Planctomycetota bacterium]